MRLNTPRIREYLKTFALQELFIEELGWDHYSAHLKVQVDGQTYILNALAEKRGVQIFECDPDADGNIPDYATRRKIENQVTKSAYEHLIVFVDAKKTMQVWQWVSRQPGQPAAYREHHYHPHYQFGDSLIQKLESITFTLSEEEGLTLSGVVFRLHDAFDRDRVTKKFYDRFKKEHDVFLSFVNGITEQGDREWYASLMLNRLMFVYFIQRKGFLDGDVDYLKNRLKMVQERKGKDNFLTFYRYFLLRLFHEGFAKEPERRAPELEELLGKVPYLDGGLFQLHELEQKHPEIDIPDEAFERIFSFFDQYEWHLDTRPLRNDREINPDVLGYIFEKYINQKQMGAYYTKEDITEYISKNTIIPYLFDAAKRKCAIAFQPGSALWQLLKFNPDRYIYPAMRKGVIDENGEIIPLPKEIEKGVKDVSQRGEWNRPANPEYALPTEIWREHVARRQRCLEVREKLKAGEIHDINDLITYNLNIRQFAQDVIENCEGPELLRAFYKAISSVKVLDPTCGSGAFLFAALNILEPLYEACLDRMQGFVDDLDRSGVRHRPEKFSDFRKILTEIERHPNRRYFILKSIIVNNLYGVDIMQEAVEICKLRLFLKLVAQVDKLEDLEPLPDIDFNIRAGNTLVGFVSLDEIRKAAECDAAGQKKMIFPEKEKEIKTIEEEAQVTEMAFQRFRDMQTQERMNSKEFASSKVELRHRLKKLSDKLDRYLAREYGVNLDKEKEFDKWRQSHQPFHWFVEFYGIMKNGGFDVIIGNPPYVRYYKVSGDYKIQRKSFFTYNTGNLYAFVVERCFQLLGRKKRFSMIMPIASVSTASMKELQELYRNNCQQIWHSHYATRPGKLFVGVDMNLTITIICQGLTLDSVHSTTYIRWYDGPNGNRNQIFDVLSYENLDIPDRHSNYFPKLGYSIEKEILKKLHSFSIYLNKFYARTDSVVYYHSGGRYWRKALFERLSSHYKGINILDEHKYKILCLLNSQIFYWYWITNSNCMDVVSREVDLFPVFDFSNLDDEPFQMLAKKLLMTYYNSSQKRVRSGDIIETVETNFDAKVAKPIINLIDLFLGEHYGLTKEELDFITNYDIKYRMGIDNYIAG